MFTLLLVLLILDAFILSIVVLLQAGQGGGLASLGGGTSDMVLGGRHAVTLLTKMTWWCGGIFLVLALVLSMMSANRRTGLSPIQQQLQTLPAPTAPAPLPIETAPPSAGTGADAGAPPTTAPDSQ